jgi:UDP-N-acetyl-D-mannosaminuronic acid dehydrogenase
MKDLTDLKICVVGLGYIGLPTAAMFATTGFDVVGYDVNENVVKSLNNGEITIEEPFLADLVKQVVSSGRLRASIKPIESDVYIIAVPTPFTYEKKADMRYVESATKDIAPLLKKGDIVILESTSPPGTTEDIMGPIISQRGFKIGEDVYLAHSPERVIPGKILFELVQNTRIVGGVNEISAKKVRELYKSFVKAEIYLTNAKTAEMCKLMENTYRDVNIALANELALISEDLGINAWEVIKYSNFHPRVNLHMPGPGVGGHCLAVDPWFIVEKTPNLAKIIKLARETNDNMPTHVFNTVKEMLGYLGDKTVTVLGLTYKPDIDDMRESPITELVHLLKYENGLTVKLHDPYVQDFNDNVEDVYASLKDSDLLILAVNHQKFSELDFDKIKGLMKTPYIYDTRNYFNVTDLIAKGYHVRTLGSGLNG